MVWSFLVRNGTAWNEAEGRYCQLFSLRVEGLLQAWTPPVLISTLNHLFLLMLTSWEIVR